MDVKMSHIATITTDAITPLTKWVTACRVVVDEFTDGNSSFEFRPLCGAAIEVASHGPIPWHQCVTATTEWCAFMGTGHQPLMSLQQLLRMATVADSDTSTSLPWLLSVWPLVRAMACDPEDLQNTPMDVRLYQDQFISYSGTTHSHHNAAVYSRRLAQVVLMLWRHGAIANPSQEVIDRCELVPAYTDIYVRTATPDTTKHYFPSMSYWLQYDGSIPITAMTLDITDDNAAAWIDATPSTHWQRVLPVDVEWPQWLWNATYAAKMAAHRYKLKYGVWPRYQSFP